MMLSVLEQALLALPLIIGAYLTLSLLKLPDFSIESAYLFGAVTAFLAKGLPLPLVLCSALGGGMLVGVVVCSLNQLFRFPYLLAAIVTNGLVHGISQYLLDSGVASFHLSLPFHELVIPIGLGVFLMGFVYIVMSSQLGYSLAIYGNNQRFFQNHNISGRYVVFSGVVLGHGFAGISGFLFAQANGFVDLTMNFGIILLCLTALMVGKLAVRKSYPNVLMPLLGVVAYFVIQQTLLRMGLNLKYFNAFQALFILGVLFFGHRKQQHSLDHLGV